MEEEILYELSLGFIGIAGSAIHGLDVRPGSSTTTLLRRFAAHFGITPRHCAYLWCFVEEAVKKKDAVADKKHLLWCLNLLKTADTEHCMAGRWRADEKTIRKWTRLFLEAISSLEVVSCFACSIYPTNSVSNLQCFIFFHFWPSSFFGGPSNIRPSNVLPTATMTMLCFSCRAPW
jgi:hypothetical protein